METIAKIVFVLGGVILLAFIFSLPVMLVWNWLIPDLFNGPYLSWVQAFGLIMLSRAFIPSSQSSD